MSCKGKCRFERNISRWVYDLGLQACTICRKAFKADRCYCCGHVMRKGAQENKARQKRIAIVNRI